MSLLHFRNTSVSSMLSDMRARCGRSMRPLCERTLSTGAEVAGVQRMRVNSLCSLPNRSMWVTSSTLHDSRLMLGELMYWRWSPSCCCGVTSSSWPTAQSDIRQTEIRTLQSITRSAEMAQTSAEHESGRSGFRTFRITTKIPVQSVHKFLSNPSDRQTDRQTDKQTEPKT